MPTVSPAVWDAMTDLMAFGTGAVVVGGSNESYGRGVMALAVDLARPGAERTVVQHMRPSRWSGQPMFTLKDDDPQITWDHKAMAARPFRERKN
jgi:hypothetical protein